MIAPLMRVAGGDPRVLVGPGTADDAGVYLLGDKALVATLDFITPVCDDPFRYGRIAAANSLSDVFAMGGKALFALNICCFPADDIPDGVYGQILEGAAEAIAESGAVLLGGHSVEDDELKFGLSVIGEADPEQILTNANARPGDQLILTKPLGTGVLINAFKAGKLDAAGLEPALVEMERLNHVAAQLALQHGLQTATDITGFGIAGQDRAGLKKRQRELLFDPQTSGGLLLATPPIQVEPLLQALLDSGHTAALIGEVVDGPARLEVL